MKQFQLTLLIVIHKKFDSIEYFDKLFNLFKSKDYDIVFAFDCDKNEIPDKYNNILNKYKNITQDKNIGKLFTVINAVQKINTRFFKIVDQDDSLYLEEMEEINKNLELKKWNSLIKHKGLKIPSKNKDIYKRFLDLSSIEKQVKKGKDIYWSQQTNFDTIYPTEIVKKMINIPLSRQTFHNDILFSNFCIGMGSDLERIPFVIYIHLYRFGQTKNFNNNRALSIPELYENYAKIIEVYPEFDYRKLLNGSKFKHKIYIWRFTKWYLRNHNKENARKIYNETYEIIEKINKK